MESPTQWTFTLLPRTGFAEGMAIKAEFEYVDE
jgi:hypothetical protein